MYPGGYMKDFSTATLLARYQETGGNIGLDVLVTEVTVKMVQEQTCLGIITDQAHQDVFNTAFFRKLGDTPYLKVLVKDNEDLLSPNYGTLEVIRQIRKDGCHSYVILLSNGAQMARLLRFGDRYRVLKTRANFLLLYDFRLFNVKLHYLWKKIVNVVFLHHYGGRRPGRRNPTHWYELTTVPFPNPIHDIFVLRRLDTWRQGKFRSGADLFREKTANLRGQMLRVVTFQHLPAAVKMLAPPLRIDRGVEGNGPIGFGGMEIENLDLLVIGSLVYAKALDQRFSTFFNPRHTGQGTKHNPCHNEQGTRVTWWSRDKVSDFCAGGLGFNPRSRQRFI
ncbi:unnamed protein product [Timema podura]|uniref:Receptor ligand binding region domain-containing protein n=1 Tax=Timema podura TaxID=61482 RepID=A0ABN7NXL5_TIMPD|nr:unnamed protein product [Timema podura]